MQFDSPILEGIINLAEGMVHRGPQRARGAHHCNDDEGKTDRILHKTLSSLFLRKKIMIFAPSMNFDNGFEHFHSTSTIAGRMFFDNINIPIRAAKNSA
jgi:hypothetical protein